MFIQGDIGSLGNCKITRCVVVVLLCLVVVTYGYAETINYGNGETYEGDLLNGKYHGYGTYIYPDGEKYIGEFKNGSYEGLGTYIYSDGEKYVGEFKDGLFHGQAVYISSSGRKFTGEYKNDRPWSGVVYSADGTVHARYVDSVYRREDTTCKRERRFAVDGKSMIDCVYSEDDRYIGGFENDEYEGYGTNLRFGASRYVGEYKNGVINGEGIFRDSDGSTYVGHFKNGAYHGRGVYVYSDGSNYIGEFKDQLFHGQGVLVDLRGQKFVGEFRNDKVWNGVKYGVDGKIAQTISNGRSVKN